MRPIAAGEGVAADARPRLEAARARAKQQSATHYALVAAVRLAEIAGDPDERLALAEEIKTLLASLPAGYDAAHRRYAEILVARLLR